MTAIPTALTLTFYSFKEAEIDCTNAITLDPQYIKAYQRRGVARQFMKSYEDAIKGMMSTCALYQQF